MIVKLKLVNGAIEIFEAEKYLLSKVADMHPDILDAQILSASGKVLARVKRKRQRHYILHDYVPLPAEDKSGREEVKKEE